MEIYVVLLCVIYHKSASLIFNIFTDPFIIYFHLYALLSIICVPAYLLSYICIYVCINEAVYLLILLIHLNMHVSTYILST